MRSASRDSMAYQQQYEERFPVEREQARQLRVAPTPRRRKRAGIRPSVMGCVMVLAVTAVYILFCQMQLTELSAAVGEQNDRLNELSAENVSLTTKQMNSMNMDEVEQYATDTLGMVKLDNSQIEYVELTNPDLVTVADDSMTLRGLWSALAARFSALVEYIR